MTAVSSEGLARGYAGYLESGDDSVFDLFSPDFFDNVSGQRGVEIFRTVGRWLDETFTERGVDVHAAMSDGDRVMLWLILYGAHIGNSIPRLVDLPATGNKIEWPQVHIFRIANGLVVEHWAVRDDARLLDQIASTSE
jgi:lactoylglutathione lyase